jgi:hypothetical protein
LKLELFIPIVDQYSKYVEEIINKSTHYKKEFIQIFNEIISSSQKYIQFIKNKVLEKSNIYDSKKISTPNFLNHIKPLASQISNIFKDEDFDSEKLIQVKAILYYLFFFIMNQLVYIKSAVPY